MLLSHIESLQIDRFCLGKKGLSGRWSKKRSCHSAHYTHIFELYKVVMVYSVT